MKINSYQKHMACMKQWTGPDYFILELVYTMRNVAGFSYDHSKLIILFLRSGIWFEPAPCLLGLMCAVLKEPQGHQFIYSWLSFSTSRCSYFEYFLSISILLSFLFLKSRDYFDQ